MTFFSPTTSLNEVVGEKNLKLRRAWIPLVIIGVTAVALIAVFLTWRYEQRCSAWEAKINEQMNNMFHPAYAEVYTSEEIESLARLALDHERPEGC